MWGERGEQSSTVSAELEWRGYAQTDDREEVQRDELPRLGRERGEALERVAEQRWRAEQHQRSAEQARHRLDSRWSKRSGQISRLLALTGRKGQGRAAWMEEIS